MTIRDGDFELLSFDPMTGVSVWLRDNGDGTITQRRDIPMDGILGSAAEDRSENAGKRWGDGQVIGTIPDGYAWSCGYMKAKLEGDTAWIKKFWNDPDHKKLRTFEGRV